MADTLPLGWGTTEGPIVGKDVGLAEGEEGLSVGLLLGALLGVEGVGELVRACCGVHCKE